MKNYLVITLGTREIQLPSHKIEEHNFEVLEEKGEKISNFFIQKISDPSIRIEVKLPSKEFPDFFTISPRTTGRIINENYSLFQPVIDFPIVRPAIEYLKQKNVSLDVIMLVYTDQEEAFKSGKVKLQNMENDSVYYADIISKLIKEDSFFVNTEIDQFAITDNVTDLGYQYDDFKRINYFLLYPEEVKQVFLYPQGGIDQINQALTLRLIEIFEVKVKQLQKAEGSDFKELDFPSKFLGSLNKQKILKHLDDFQFGLLNEPLLEGLSTKDKIYNLSRYAYQKLNLNYTAFPKGIDSKFKEPNSVWIRCKDLYLSAKICFKVGDYGNYLWKLFTIYENIYRSRCEEYIGETQIYYDPKFDRDSKSVNSSWHEFLQNCVSNETQLDGSTLFEYVQSRKLGKNTPININNPNKLVFKHIYIFLFSTGIIHSNEATLNEKKILEDLDDSFYKLLNLRNKIAHNMAPVSYELLSNTLGKNKLNDFNKSLDELFNTSSYGIYDEIKSTIEDLINSLS